MGINLMQDRVCDDLAAEFTIRYSTQALRAACKELIALQLEAIEHEKQLQRVKNDSEFTTSAGLVRRDTSHLYPSSPKYKKPLADPIDDTWIATGREG